jgi:hypothetical protein
MLLLSAIGHPPLLATIGSGVEAKQHQDALQTRAWPAFKPLHAVVLHHFQHLLARSILLFAAWQTQG